MQPSHRQWTTRGSSPCPCCAPGGAWTLISRCPALALCACVDGPGLFHHAAPAEHLVGNGCPCVRMLSWIAARRTAPAAHLVGPGRSPPGVLWSCPVVRLEFRVSHCPCCAPGGAWTLTSRCSVVLSCGRALDIPSIDGPGLEQVCHAAPAAHLVGPGRSPPGVLCLGTGPGYGSAISCLLGDVPASGRARVMP